MSEICEKFRRNVDLYLDGQLDRSSETALEHHLSRCEGCRTNVQKRQTLILRVRQFGRKVQAPQTLRKRLPEEPNSGGKYRRVLQWTVAAAVACALFLFGFFYAFPGWTPGELATLEGKLICMGKKLEEQYRVHWDCGNYGHLPVLETGSGEIWHLVNNQPAHELSREMTDDFHPEVGVTAYVYADEHFIEVQSYRYLPTSENQKGERR